MGKLLHTSFTDLTNSVAMILVCSCMFTTGCASVCPSLRNICESAFPLRGTGGASLWSLFTYSASWAARELVCSCSWVMISMSEFDGTKLREPFLWSYHVVLWIHVVLYPSKQHTHVSRECGRPSCHLVLKQVPPDKNITNSGKIAKGLLPPRAFRCVSKWGNCLLRFSRRHNTWLGTQAFADRHLGTERGMDIYIHEIDNGLLYKRTSPRIF